MNILKKRRKKSIVSSARNSSDHITAYKSFYSQYVKRWIGFILATTLTFFLSPIIILISVVIVADTGFPIFYRGERGGFRGNNFRIFKFRSMVKNADQIGGGTTALFDNRITKVGNIIRKTKLDEIPQLFNIILGDMAFIGPRPELVKYTSRYEGDEKLILEVRPGITDFSSIEFINLDEVVGENNADEVYETYILKQKNSLRIKYVEEISFKTDLKLFFLTIAKVIEKMAIFVKEGH